ncbi:uncharacterized protein Z518_10441 [Rhinocladiella mackenziei CBS 650.93]|uniref:Rhinocladiella mackenziei CBS 650.93 unplaced genomic scaffold supercont1.9, whole genome shotgun sequence n=1 Tax=Rhinocladiella mackenziei CBS 650.93 TaxID=1442369 RepID=A0A0D2FDY5_9EURO|nr:uncharacterized protein Z518_10441 [Rhinocladiella mackenziei CBS 650.93]KIX00302.1 hypothetical protein Z518_10441 [Rhinocladiella mackenziei CBS 650.93]
MSTFGNKSVKVHDRELVQLSIVPQKSDYTGLFGHYSRSSGVGVNKKALMIGVNYFRQRGQLCGSIREVQNMSAYLNLNFGYPRENMVILTDDQRNPFSQPTRANILRAMCWLVKDVQSNDSLVFHYSGHGPQPPSDKEEEEGCDEVIFPVDFRSAGCIIGIEIYKIMIQGLPAGVKLKTIFDYSYYEGMTIY